MWRFHHSTILFNVAFPEQCPGSWASLISRGNSAGSTYFLLCTLHSPSFSVAPFSFHVCCSYGPTAYCSIFTSSTVFVEWKIRGHLDQSMVVLVLMFQVFCCDIVPPFSGKGLYLQFLLFRKHPCKKVYFSQEQPNGWQIPGCCLKLWIALWPFVSVYCKETVRLW